LYRNPGLGDGGKLGLLVCLYKKSMLYSVGLPPSPQMSNQ
jgi:hypothetical protein